MNITNIKKFGFTLIEVVVALFISSFISVSIYQLLLQTQRSVSFVNEVIEADLSLPVFYNQMEKDITGIINQSTRYKQDNNKQEKKSEMSMLLDTMESFLGSHAAKKGSNPKESNPSDSKEDIDIKNIFVATNQENQFSMSFITTTGIQPIPSGEKSTGLIGPRVKRVRYKLELDPYIEQQNIYRIMYEQAPTIASNFENQTGNTSYELITNIKSIKARYFVYEPQDEDTANSSQNNDQNNNQDNKLVALDSWNAQDIKEKYKTVIPAYIELDIIFVNPNAIDIEQPIKFSFRIPAYTFPDAKKDKQDKDKQDTKNNTLNTQEK